MKLSFKRWEKEYIGNYVQEYRSAGLLKVKSLKEVLKEREERISEDKIPIDMYNNRFLSYVLLQYSSESNAKISDYKRIMNGIERIKYIDKSDYEEIKKLLDKKKEEKRGDKDLSYLKQYINEFALIVVYAKNRCFTEWDRHYNKMQKVLNDSKRIEVRNFFAEIARTGIDVDKITIQCNGRKNLKIDSPILMKMMIYSFAREYYTFVEKADAEHWEDELITYKEDITSGLKKNADSKNISALINVYLDFIEHIGAFKEQKSKELKYLIIGRLLTIAGLEKYNEEINEKGEKHLGYVSETNYYQRRISRRIGK